METVPVTRLEELDQHLDELVEDPNTDLNAELFDHVELQLTGTPEECSSHEDVRTDEATQTRISLPSSHVSCRDSRPYSSNTNKIRPSWRASP